MPESVQSEVVSLAQKAIEATPSVETIAKALGEENLRGDPEGKWEVRAVNRDGSPSLKKAKLLREMMQERNRLEAKMVAAQPGRPVIEREEPRVARGTFGYSPAYANAPYWRDR